MNSVDGEACRPKRCVSSPTKFSYSVPGDEIIDEDTWSQIKEGMKRSAARKAEGKLRRVSSKLRKSPKKSNKKRTKKSKDAKRSNGGDDSPPALVAGSSNSVSSSDKSPESQEMAKKHLSRSFRKASKKASSFMKGMFKQKTREEEDDILKTKTSVVSDVNEKEDDASTSNILKDLEIVSQLKLPGINARKRQAESKTTKEILNDPTAVMERAEEYKKTAEDLLASILPKTEPSETGGGGAAAAAAGKTVIIDKKNSQGQDPRDIEAKAVKALKYAAEARRILDVFEKLAKKLKVQQAHGVGTETESTSKPGAIDGSLLISTCSSDSLTSDSFQPSVLKAPGSPASSSKGRKKVTVDPRCDRDATRTSESEGKEGPVIVRSGSTDSSFLSELTSGTTFSEEIEREDHRRKMKEIELFQSPSQIGSSLATEVLRGWSRPGDNYLLSAYYAAEAQKVLHKLDIEKSRKSQDVIKAAGFPHSDKPYGHDEQSCVTSASDRETRKMYEKNIDELANFTATTLAASMWQSMQDGLEKMTDYGKKGDEESYDVDSLFSCPQTDTETVVVIESDSRDLKGCGTANTEAASIVSSKDGSLVSLAETQQSEQDEEKEEDTENGNDDADKKEEGEGSSVTEERFSVVEESTQKRFVMNREEENEEHLVKFETASVVKISYSTESSIETKIAIVDQETSRRPAGSSEVTIAAATAAVTVAAAAAATTKTTTTTTAALQEDEDETETEYHDSESSMSPGNSFDETTTSYSGSDQSFYSDDETTEYSDGYSQISAAEGDSDSETGGNAISYQETMSDTSDGEADSDLESGSDYTSSTISGQGVGAVVSSWFNDLQPAAF